MGAQGEVGQQEVGVAAPQEVGGAQEEVGGAQPHYHNNRRQTPPMMLRFVDFHGNH